MAQQSSTFETFDAVGNREELANVIHQISPEETPMMSLIGRQSIKTTHPEWQTDTLATPSTSNNVPEGNEWTYNSVSPTTRVGNYAQISEKSFVISATQDQYDKAGRKSEVARETSKKGLELRTDMEVILMSNQASSAGSGNGATNRTSGGLRAWLATNDSLGSGGSSGGFNTSTSVVDAATNGTQRAFTKTILDTVIQNTYVAGGSPTTLIVSPYVKQVFSTFMSDSNVATQRYVTPKSGQTTIVAAADTYQSDFGPIMIVPNRQMARLGAASARNAFLIDPTMITAGIYRDFKVNDPAQTGDAIKKVINVEYTLIVKNEAAHGVAADLFGMTAST